MFLKKIFFHKQIETGLFILRQKFTKKKEPFVYVALGDSTVLGVGASKPERTFPSLIYFFLKQQLKEAVYHNFGQGGAKVNDVLNKHLEQALPLKPDLVILSIGANDVFYRTSLKTFEKDFRQILEKIAQTKALVVINGIPDLSLAPMVPKLASPYFMFQVPQFNKVIKKLSKEYGATFIDLYNQSKLFKGYTELISQDGLHPSDAGYALWANTIISRIYPLIRSIH